MKKLILLFSALAFIFTTAFTGGEVCSGNDFFHKGVKCKTGYYDIYPDTIFDNRSKTSYTIKPSPLEKGEMTSEVADVYSSGDSTIAVLNNTYSNLLTLRKTSTDAADTKLICINGTFLVDMDAVIEARMLGQDIQLSNSGNRIGYKESYVVGEKLDTVNFNVEAHKNGKLWYVVHNTIYDRVVESYEDLTLPAGVFKCYKISYHTYETTERKGKEIRGPSRRTQELQKSVVYYCPQVGIVRTEEYKNDELVSFTQLLELTKH